MAKFSVTYGLWDEESLSEGDPLEVGHISYGASLRDAIADVTGTRANTVDGSSVEPSCSDLRSARWITVNNGMDWSDGTYESRSIHFPDNVTGASRVRIARLLGIKES